MGARIDKFLWSVRIFKTRSKATEACRSGKVTIDGIAVKAAKEVEVGTIIKVKKDHIHHEFKVLALLEKRVGAKLVSDFVLETTSPEELNKLEIMKQNFEYRDRGLGRPTKKDRRILSKIKNTKY